MYRDFEKAWHRLKGNLLQLIFLLLNVLLSKDREFLGLVLKVTLLYGVLTI